MIAALLAGEVNPFDVPPNILAGLAGALAWATAIVYFTFSRWRLTSAGRSFMYLVTALAILLTMNTIHLLTGSYDAIWVTRTTVYGFLAFAVGKVLFTLITILVTGNPITVRTFVEPKLHEGERYTKPANER